jgi:hypothetical protein
MPDYFGFREMKNSLTPEERKKAIDDPGTPWKVWWYAQGSKTWIGVGMMILDVFLYGTIWMWTWPYAHYMLIPAMPFALYLNYLLWNYLWRVPDLDELRKGQIERTALHPWPVGRWTEDYAVWKAQGVAGLHGDAINPGDFV